MHCVILAAGTSSRLLPLTAHTPKCLLCTGGRSILERMVAAIAHADVHRFTIVVGYRHELIRDFAAQHFAGLEVDFAFNPEFATTNTASSLLCAAGRVGNDDLLLLDGDILFDAAIITSLLQAPAANALAIRTQGEVGSEDVKVIVDAECRITHVGKELPVDESWGESIGIAKFDAASAHTLFTTLNERLSRPSGAGEYYEAAFQQMIDASVPLYALDLKELCCIEIDTVEDWEQAATLFQEASSITEERGRIL